ncbi:MAG: slipin family protein [Planctomycetes bacterium]|nr:slipin family protein [Planctomycetota bacterium]
MNPTILTLLVLCPIAVLVAGIALVIRRRLIVDVEPHEQVYATRKGTRFGPLATGRHVFWQLPWLGTARVDRFDLRSLELHVAGQELLTKDRVQLKATALAYYRIVDANKLLDELGNWQHRVYYETQLALRAVIATIALDDLLENRQAASDQVNASLAPVFAAYGCTLENAKILDWMLSGDLKRAMAEAAEARARGKAKLERARAEAASLRNLANAARMVRENRELLELRTLEVADKAAESTGNTLVLGLDDLKSLSARA